MKTKNLILLKIEKLFLLILLIYLKYLFKYFYELKNKSLLNNNLFNSIYNNNGKNTLNSILSLKKVVYSALFGEYDEIRKFNLQKGYDYYLFTDNNHIKYNETNWTILPIPETLKILNLSIIKKQRYLKLHPHLYFQHYDLSIYIDSSFRVKGDLNNFLLRILSPKYNIYNLEHPSRSTILNETFQVINLHKEKESMVNTIRRRYQIEKFPDKNGLIEGSIIIRRHNEKDCIYLMNKWYEQIEKYSHRDQLSFNYIIWKTGIKNKYIVKNFALEYFAQNAIHLQVILKRLKLLKIKNRYKVEKNKKK